MMVTARCAGRMASTSAESQLMLGKMRMRAPFIGALHVMANAATTPVVWLFGTVTANLLQHERGCLRLY